MSNVIFFSFEQEPSQIPPAVAGPSRGGQAEVSSRPISSHARQHKGQRLLLPFWWKCVGKSSHASGFSWQTSPLSHMRVVGLIPCALREGWETRVGGGVTEKKVL